MFRRFFPTTQPRPRSGYPWLLGPAGSLLVAIALSGGLAACGNSTPATRSTAAAPNPTNPSSQTATAGEYPVQQASYNNSTGEYTLMLLNAPPGMNPYRASNLQMAQLTEAALKAGKTSYLALTSNGSQPVLYLQPTFKIEMLSGTPANTTMQAGVQPTYWQPMGGGGELDIDLDFHQPYYYVPPPYRPGAVLTGYGGYGHTYERAASTYQQRYNAPPAPVQTRNFRTTPNLRPSPKPNALAGAPGSAPASAPLSGPVKASSSRFGSNAARTAQPARPTEPAATRSSPNSARSSGSGYGSSTLRSSGSSSVRSRPSNNSNRRSFGSGRRRR